MYTYMQNFPALYSPFTPGLMFTIMPLVIVIAVWTILIKGYALWHAARNGQKGWFVALLVINTIGILEIIYLVWFSPKGSNRLNPNAPAANSSPQV